MAYPAAYISAVAILLLASQQIRAPNHGQIL